MFSIVEGKNWRHLKTKYEKMKLEKSHYSTKLAKQQQNSNI